MSEPTETSDIGRVPLTAGDRVRVDGWRGIAFSVIGPTTEHRYSEPEWLLVCENDDCEHDDEDCYALVVDEDGCDVETGQVDVVMVGDDREWSVDPDDCTPIGADAFCSCCGQVGCPWGAEGSAS